MSKFQWYIKSMRSLQPALEKDLLKKFVLLSGPRQVGKTHLAKTIIRAHKGAYYNWDLAEDRRQILEKGFLHDRWVVLDELHKYDRWKNFIKGVFDKFHENLKILVTGSARLDVYRRGGDSLTGRYFLLHLHPFTVGEVCRPRHIPSPEEVSTGQLSSTQSHAETFQSLLKLGGFPEPFLEGSESHHRRWSLQRQELLIQEEIRDLTQIQLLSLVEHLLLLLPKRVGSLLSLNSLREDLQVAYNTVASWIKTLERLFVIFKILPYSQNLSRSIHKEGKVYFWDWSQVNDPAARFENIVASHLFKAISLWRDLGFGNFELHFLRDRLQREIDFCVTKDHKPYFLLEAKLGESQVSPFLHYFSERLGVPAVQLVAQKGIAKKEGSVFVASADRWLAQLP